MRRRVGKPVPLETAILHAFVADPRAQIHGFALAKVLAGSSAKSLTGHGTLYRALERMERAGWLTSEWEAAENGAADGRPPRRLYSITTGGREVLAAEQVAAPSRTPEQGWINP